MMIVETGQLPNEEASVEQALRLFLIEELDNGQPPMSSATEPEKGNVEEARTLHGVYALEFPDEVLFTKPIDMRPEQLDDCRPQGVTSERRAGDANE